MVHRDARPYAEEAEQRMKVKKAKTAYTRVLKKPQEDASNRKRSASSKAMRRPRDAAMKILFFGRRFTYFRNFDSVLRELAGARPRDSPRGRARDGRRPAARRGARSPSIRARSPCGVAPGRADDDWSWVASRLRLASSTCATSTGCSTTRRSCATGRASARLALFVALGDAVGRYARWARRPIEAVLRWLERSTPDDPGIRAYVERTASRRRAHHAADRPRLVADRLLCGRRDRSAFRRRSASGAGTTCPARRSFASCPIACSSGTRRRSARRMSSTACPPERIVVTGAQCFDKWFDRAAVARSRDVLPPGRAARGSADPAVRVLGAVQRQPAGSAVRRRLDPAHPRRSASARLRDTPILVRPHPSRRRRVGGRRSDAVRRRGRVGQRPGRCATRAPTTSTRSTTAPSSSGSTPARSSKPESSAGRCTPSCCPSGTRARWARCTSGTCSRPAADC